MVNTGYGQLLIDRKCIADIIYTILSRTIGDAQQYQVRFTLRHGGVATPQACQLLELICANGVHYQIRGTFDLDAGGTYVADLIPLPTGMDDA